MFEDLRGLPPKPEKTTTKKRKGCATTGYGLLVLIFAGIVGLIIIFGTLGKDFFDNFRKFAEELKVEVSEAEMAPNKLVEADFVGFENVINSSITNIHGYPFFDENHNMYAISFMAEDLIFHNNITLSSRQFACFCADVVEANVVPVYNSSLNRGAVTIIELNLETSGTTTNITGVIKIKPGKIFDEYNIYQKRYNLPETLYFVSTFSFNNMSFEILSASLQVNKLSPNSNAAVVQVLAGCAKVSADEFCKMPAQNLLNGLREFEQKYHKIVTFEGNSATATLM